MNAALTVDALRDETIQHLQALIRLDTSNPPGNESLAADYIARVLDAAGIAYVMPERTPGRANIVARLRGTGEKAPLLLMGHTDVVPAEPDSWTHPPFGAEIADGYLWGRGALDMKFMVAYELAVFLALHREGVPLHRDLILAATADEEIAEGNGIDWLAAQHPELIRAEYALNELGGMTSWIANHPVYDIQVAEKGVCWLRLTVYGEPGHASVPRRDNPVTRLAQQIARLGTARMPLHITETAHTYLNGLADVLGTDTDTLIAYCDDLDLQSPLSTALADEERRHLYAMLHNTAVPTGLSGGYKTNVIPGSSSAIIDGRTLPGFDSAGYLDELRVLLDPDVQIEVMTEAPPLEVPHDNDLFRLMRATLEKAHPGAVVLPSLMTGATDAKYLAPLGIKVYGFSPIRIEQGTPGSELIHSHDERIPLDGLTFGVGAVYDVVSQFVQR